MGSAFVVSFKWVVITPLECRVPFSVVRSPCLPDFVVFIFIQQDEGRVSLSEGCRGVEDCHSAFKALCRFPHTAALTGFCTLTPLVAAVLTGEWGADKAGELWRSLHASHIPGILLCMGFSFCAVPSGVRFPLVPWEGFV